MALKERATLRTCSTNRRTDDTTDRSDIQGRAPQRLGSVRAMLSLSGINRRIADG